MINYEFEIGDNVTFNPYGHPVKGIVRSRRIGCALSPSKDNNEPHYILHGRAGDSLITDTTGRSIMESKSFIPYYRK